jgi:hypothetical protein
MHWPAKLILWKNSWVYRPLSFAKTPRQLNFIHVTCYTVALYVVDFKCTPNFDEAQAKLARLVYRMLRYGMKYVDQGAALYEAQHRHLQIRHLKFKAASLGYQLIQISAA